MTQQVGLRIEKELADWLTKEAKKENRSFNNFITTILLQEQERRESENARHR